VSAAGYERKTGANGSRARYIIVEPLAQNC